MVIRIAQAKQQRVFKKIFVIMENLQFQSYVASFFASQMKWIL